MSKKAQGTITHTILIKDEIYNLKLFNKLKLIIYNNNLIIKS